jgi:tetratricopeptide (TPR) repeat protein/S1-C subfamily serine protease
VKPAALIIATLILTQLPIEPVTSLPIQPATQQAPPANQADSGLPAPEIVKRAAQAITVRVSAPNNGGSGAIIGRKGNSYLVLTNAHVVRRATKLDIQAPDGQSYQAKLVDGSFDEKTDLALLQFTSKSEYKLANLSSISGSSLDSGREIYSTGFPFDSKNIRITKGTVSQTTDIPFDDGTQVGYVTDKGEKGIRQGMSGGAIVDSQGLFIGINTIGIAPILPDYTYNDGSKPISKLKAEYTRANWGIPVYNFLARVKPDILYDYHLPKVEHQVTPTGYMAEQSQKARKMTVRIENNDTGSGVIVAKSGNARDGFTYYVLTAKHVVDGNGNSQIITYDQDRHQATSTVVAKGVDLAVVKFNSKNDYSLAKLNEYSPNDNDLVFVGGFPERTKINSPLWQWQLNPGFVYSREQGKLETQNKLTFADKYDLLYSSNSYGGMSGGPVFDLSGSIIGIHGRGESENLNSAGISIQTFTGLLKELQIDPKLLSIVDTRPKELSTEQVDNVKKAMENIPKPEGTDENGERWLAYGTQLYRLHKYAAAVDAFKIAISKGQALSGNYRLALALHRIGEYQAAADAIAKAIDLVKNNKANSENNYYLWKSQCMIFTKSENYTQALTAIDRAIALDSQDLTSRNQKAVILSKLGNKQGAIDEYNIIINKQPDAYIYYNRGNTKFESGRKEEAIKDYTNAIALNPKLAVSYNNRGVAKSDLGRKEEAIQDYTNAIALNSKYTDAYNNRGNAKSDLGRKEEAIQDYTNAIALNSKYAIAYNNRGITKSDLDRKQEAIQDYTSAINLNPKYTDAYNNRGNAKSDLGRKEEAIQDYTNAIALNSKYAIAYNNRGIAKFNLGRKEEAIQDYTSAINVNSKFAEAYYNRGVTKNGLSRKEEAIKDYTSAIEFNPKYAEAYNNRGVVAYELGQKVAAIQDMKTAADLFRQQGQMDLYQKAMDLIKQIQGS